MIKEGYRSCSVCGSIHQLEVHHIVSRGMGGSSRPEIEAPENKILICRNCHTEITEHRWDLSRSPSELVVTAVTTGETVARRHYDPSFDASDFMHGVNVLETSLEALLPGIRYLTDEQLVELFQQLRGLYSGEHYRRECTLLREWAEKQRGAHWTEFLARWNDPLA